MSTNLALLVQSVRKALSAWRGTARSRTLGASHLSAGAQARRLTLLAVLVLPLVACAVPPEPPIAIAADGPPRAATPTAARTLVPTPRVRPTVAPAPTLVPTALPAPRYDLVLVGGPLMTPPAPPT